MNWDLAACKGFSDTHGYDPFFPIILDEFGEEIYDDGTVWGSFGNTDHYYDEARKICDKCPIKKECLNHALSRKERWGMWGGSTPIDRRRVERKERRNKLKLKRQRQEEKNNE